MIEVLCKYLIFMLVITLASACNSNSNNPQDQPSPHTTQESNRYDPNYITIAKHFILRRIH